MSEQTHPEQSDYDDPPVDELRDTAIIAEVYVRIDAARLYGLIEGGPAVDVVRCEEIIDQAHAAGHVWTEDEITKVGALVFRQWQP